MVYKKLNSNTVIDIGSLKWKVEKDIPWVGQPKKAGMAILITNNVGFWTKLII
jgi:hypothetical protein